MMVRSVNGTERHRWKLGEEANRMKKEEVAGGGVERTWLTPLFTKIAFCTHHNFLKWMYKN